MLYENVHASSYRVGCSWFMRIFFSFPQRAEQLLRRAHGCRFVVQGLGILKSINNICLWRDFKDTVLTCWKNNFYMLLPLFYANPPLLERLNSFLLFFYSIFES